MRIGFLSDVHDHVVHLTRCLEHIKNNQIDYIFHLGDFGAPGTCVVPLLALEIPVYAIWGNNDGEKWKVTSLFCEAPHADISGTVYRFIQLDGKKFFLSHYDDIPPYVAASGLVDVVVSGHNHLRHEERIGNTLWVNPGSICGNKQTPSYAVYETQKHAIEFIEL